TTDEDTATDATVAGGSGNVRRVRTSPGQYRIVPEDLPLQARNLLGRRRTEPDRQELPQPPARGQRVGLPPGPVERDHQRLRAPSRNGSRSTVLFAPSRPPAGWNAVHQP